MFLCELALRGRFAVIDEPLFRRRLHYRNMFFDPRARMAWFSPAEKGRIRFPHWLALRGLLRVVFTSDIGLSEKVRCLGVVANWTVKFSRPLANDLVVAARWLMGGKPAQEGIAYNWESDAHGE